MTEQYTTLYESDLRIFHSNRARKLYVWAGRLRSFDEPFTQRYLSQKRKDSNFDVVYVCQGEETEELCAVLGQGFLSLRGHREGASSSYLMSVRKLFQKYFAFDEVECSPAFLCSGMVFILKLEDTVHIWRGKGSFVSEFLAARSKAEEMCPTGSIMEESEANESSTFWNILGHGEYASASYWYLRPRFEHTYACKIYIVDSKQVRHMACAILL